MGVDHIGVHFRRHGSPAFYSRAGKRFFLVAEELEDWLTMQ